MLPLLFGFLAAVIAWYLLAPGTSVPPGEPHVTVPAGTEPHVAGDPSRTLSRVHIRALYVVPRDRADLAWSEWPGSLRDVLGYMRAFHALQFRGASELTYDVTPSIVFGEQDGAFYDNEDTNRGNPHAWETLKDELQRRFGFIQEDGMVFNVRVVFYEGVGALGGEDQVLVSSGYLRQPAAMAASILYHELGHTFGLSDAYEYEHGAPLDEDIMGLGRNKPIGETYLSEKAKQELGIRN